MEERGSQPSSSSSQQLPAPEVPLPVPPVPLDLQEWLADPVLADFLASIDESLWGQAVRAACILGLATVRRAMKHPDATWGELHDLVTRTEQQRQGVQPGGAAATPGRSRSGLRTPGFHESTPPPGLVGRAVPPSLPHEPAILAASSAGSPAADDAAGAIQREDEPAYVRFTEMLLESPQPLAARRDDRVASPPGLERPPAWSAAESTPPPVSRDAGGRRRPPHLAPGARWPPSQEPLSDFDLVKSAEDSLNSWFAAAFHDVVKGAPTADLGEARHFTYI